MLDFSLFVPEINVEVTGVLEVSEISEHSQMLNQTSSESWEFYSRSAILGSFWTRPRDFCTFPIGSYTSYIETANPCFTGLE